MERLLAVHTVICAAEGMDGTIVEMDSDDTKHKQQLLSKSVVKSSVAMKREIEHVLTDHGVVSKANVETTVESRLTKWTTIL